MDAFTTRSTTIGGSPKVDISCAAKGCPWHKVVPPMPRDESAVLTELRTHAREHQAVASA